MTVPVVRKRAKHSKTRSGCRTCRQRHVKCDEQRPTCNTCATSNRVCGGYDFVPLPATQAKPKKLVTAIIKQGPVVPTIDLNAFESASFDFFRRFTINQLPEKVWWQHLALDLGRQEPALAHAAVALGSMHRALTVPSSQTGLDQYQTSFATQQYGKAMNLMRQYIEQGQKSHSRLRESEVVVVLLASLLFFCLEAYMGRDEQAAMHLRTGLRILYEHTQGPITSPVSVTDAGDDDEDKIVTTTTSLRSYMDALKYAFILLDSDMNMVDEEEPFLQSVCLDRMPLAFQNVQTASIHLDCLASRANNRWREILNIAEGYFDEHPEYCDTLDEDTYGFLLGCTSRLVTVAADDPFLKGYQDMRQDLREWLHAWATVPQEDSNLSDHLQCSIFFFYVWFRVETWRDATEMLADRFEEQFAHIVSLGEKYIALHQSPAPFFTSNANTSKQTYNTPPLFSFGTGFVTTMMVIAIKCRTTSIRRRCVSLIRRVNLQGFFNSEFLAGYLETIIELEQQRARAISGYPATKTSFEMDEICEEARIFEPMMLPGRHCNKTEFYNAKVGDMVFADYSNGPGSPLIIRQHKFERW